MTWTYFKEKILLLDPNVMKPAEPRTRAQPKEWMHHGLLGYFVAHMLLFFLAWYWVLLIGVVLTIVWEIPEYLEMKRAAEEHKRWYKVDMIQDFITKVGGVAVGLVI